MLVPPTLKLFTGSVYSGLPFLSKLWKICAFGWGELSTKCPNLQVLMMLEASTDEISLKDDLLSLLRARKKNVESRLEVDNVKMEPLKKLVIPFKEHSARALEKCRELVGEVVDWDLEPQFFEVEI